MGKADNIKRAKRLKEAKRKREQDALLATGLGPAGILIQKRAASIGGKTIINQGEIKYSKLLELFVQPIISEDDDIATVKAKYTFGAHVWNAATVREFSEEKYQLARKEFTNIVESEAAMEELFDEMAKRKQEEFSEYKNIIADFDIKKIRGGDYDLSVATVPLKEP